MRYLTAGNTQAAVRNALNYTEVNVTHGWFQLLHNVSHSVAQLEMWP